MPRHRVAFIGAEREDAFELGQRFDAIAHLPSPVVPFGVAGAREGAFTERRRRLANRKAERFGRVDRRNPSLLPGTFGWLCGEGEKGRFETRRLGALRRRFRGQRSVHCCGSPNNGRPSRDNRRFCVNSLNGFAYGTNSFPTQEVSEALRKLSGSMADPPMHAPRRRVPRGRTGRAGWPNRSCCRRLVSIGCGRDPSGHGRGMRGAGRPGPRPVDCPRRCRSRASSAVRLGRLQWPGAAS